MKCSICGFEAKYFTQQLFEKVMICLECDNYRRRNGVYPKQMKLWQDSEKTVGDVQKGVLG